jgi:hypothetical protein
MSKKSSKRLHRLLPLALLALTLVFALSSVALRAQEGEERPFDPDDPAFAPIVLSQIETENSIQTITEIPVAMDTFATSGIPEGQWPAAFTNRGDRTDLRLGYTTTDGFGAQRIYLWFNIAAANIPSNATINSATLRIWASDSGPEMGFEARHLSSSWNEFTLTWMSNAPQWGGSLGTGVVSAGSGEKNGNATNLVRDWVSGQHPNNGIIIIGNEGQANPFTRVFLSREAGSQFTPRLIVDWVIAVDTVPPESTITQLPVFSPGQVNVSWTGIDFGNPATGIAFWDVDYATDGINWVQWIRGTTNQSAIWQAGADGNIYFFRVRAVDNAGNVESWTRNAAQQQTNTTIDSIPPTVTFQDLPPFTYESGFPITFTGQDNRSGVRQYEVQFNVNGGPWQFGQVFQLGSGPQTRFVTGAVHGETYGFRVRATDIAGNTGPWSNETFTQVFTTPPLPDTRVLPFVPPNHVAGPPGIANDPVFRVTWATQTAPGTALLDQTDVRYRCDTGAWVVWLTNASGTFADFDTATNNTGCTPGAQVNRYEFEAVGRVQYPTEVRADAWTQQAEASVVFDPNNLMEVRAFLPLIAQAGGGLTAVNQPPAPTTILTFAEE